MEQENNLALIAGSISPGSLFYGKIRVEERVDSTNTRLKVLGLAGAPEGTVLLAQEQTAGRGTQGKQFFSPKGTGLYLSLLLRPRGELSRLLTLTGWVAVAVAQGIRRACGAPVEIKWLNDIYLNGKKLCGILTELSFPAAGAAPDFVVIGAGVNVGQSRGDFQARGLENIATSLAAEGFRADRAELCLCILEAMEEMYRVFPAGREMYLDEYRARCLTIGRRVRFVWDGAECNGTARNITPGFALAVRGDDGVLYEVSSGHVALL